LEIVMAPLARDSRPFLFLILLTIPRPAAAANLSWITLGNGSAASAANWSPAQVPAAADILLFNLAGPRTVTWNAMVPASTLHVYRTGTNLLSFTSPHFASAGVVVGSQNGDNAIANVTTGTLATGGSSTIGSAAGSTGSMTVTGSNVLFQVQNAAADLFVGASGAGNLTVSAGGVVRVNDDLILGNAAGSGGTVVVTGASALNSSTLETATADADILIGSGGNGTLSVASSGVVNVADDMALATGPSTFGALNVTGTNSTVTVNDVCSVSSNATAGVAGGLGGINVNAGGTMVVKDSLRVGDPDGGTGVLHMNGGFLHVKHLTMDGSNGDFDWDGGTLRIDGGAATAGSPIVMSATTGASRLEVIRGATFAVTGGLSFSGGSGSLAVDSDALLNLSGGDLIATTGTFAVTVDSSSLLAARDMQLGGSSSNTSLAVTNGSYLALRSFESADEGGAVSTIQLNGTGSHIDWDNVFYLAGDAGHAGGTADMTIANGGLLRGDGSSSSLKIWPGGVMHVNSGGAIDTPGDMTLLGLLDMGGGTSTIGAITLQGNGRIRGRGTVAARVVSGDPTTRISAVGGDLTLGQLVFGGFVFAGTLEAGGSLVTLVSALPITLGDTTTVDEGRIRTTSVLTNPGTGVLRAIGALEAPTLANAGVLSIGGTAPDTLRVQGALNLQATSTLRVRIRGTSPNQADRIHVTGAANLGGTLELFFDPDGVYPSNTTVPFLTFPSRTNSFASVIAHGLDPSRFAVVSTATAIQVVFIGTVAVEPGAELPRVVAFTGRSAAGSTPGGFELALPRAARVHVALYDVRGREVTRLVDGPAPAGLHRHALPQGLRRGVYFGRARIREDGAADEIVRTDRVVVR
jgi:T5SS/PEP-CTERM-associated repeat protein